MPPKRKAKKTSAPKKSAYVVNVKIAIPHHVIEEAQRLPDKACNEHVQQYLLTNHAINIKNLSFAKPVAPTPRPAAAARNGVSYKTSGLAASAVPYDDDDEENLDYYG